MSDFSVRLFGPFEVYTAAAAGSPARLRSSTDQALLAYLLLHHGRPVSRETLAALFWGHADAETAARLHRSLVELRKSLGEEARRLRAPSENTLTFDLIGAEADFLTFERGLEDGGPEKVQAAVSVYRGDFLEGIRSRRKAPPWQGWVEERRARFRSRFVDALAILFEDALARRQFPGARYSLHRLATVPGLSRGEQERRWERLLQSAAAVKEWAFVLDILEERKAGLEERGEDLPPTLRALYREIPPDVVREARGREKARERRFRSLSTFPVYLTSFVGRETELGALDALFSPPQSKRLITLTGGAGVGKTRLATQAAERLEGRFPGGVGFASLGPLAEPEQVAPSLAAALRLPDDRETDTLGERIARHLRGRRRPTLLVLDNCEHLVEPCAALVAELLSACPMLTVLATSREALGLPGEAVFPVRPLSPPAADGETLETLLACPAARLFRDRVRDADPSFDFTPANAGAVAHLCARLEGLPLATEIIAPLVALSGIVEMVEQIEQRLPLDHARRGGPAFPAHHRTLSDALDWSISLLTPEARAVFPRLGVFAGSFSGEATQAVCQDGEGGILVPAALRELVGKSLLLREDDEQGRSRYRLLEFVRQYALEWLGGSRDVARETRRRHRDFYLALVEELSGTTQETLLRRLDAEQENLVAALETCLEEAGEEAARRGLRLVAAAARYWEMRGYRDQARHWFEKALSHPFAGTDMVGRGNVLTSWSAIEPDREKALALAEEAVNSWRTYNDSARLSEALLNLAGILTHHADNRRARLLTEEALALHRHLPDASSREHSRRESALMFRIGILALREGDVAGARQHLNQTERLCTVTGDLRLRMHVLGGLAQADLLTGDIQAAGRYYAQCLRLCQDLGSRADTPIVLEGIAHVLLRRHATDERADETALASWERAARLLGAAQALRRRYCGPPPATLQARADADRASLRALLGAERMHEAERAGEQLSWEEAIQLAQMGEW